MRAGWLGVAATALALGACGRGQEGAGAPNGDILSNALLSGADGGQEVKAAASDRAPPEVEAPAKAGAGEPVAGWFGRWNGPEGTFLTIARHPGGFPRVMLSLKDDLDGPAADYIGHTSGATIRFHRRGKELTIRHGRGAETGFKWLLDRQDCLILVAGQEGYCRD